MASVAAGARTSAGQPRMENGQSPEENHVSSTSLSCSKEKLAPLAIFAARSVASVRERPTTQRDASAICTAGINQDKLLARGTARTSGFTPSTWT